MSRSAMESAWAAMSPGWQRGLADARAKLLEVADQIDNIIGIIGADPNVVGSSALVMTKDRIVECTTGGSMQVLRYQDLSWIQIVGGQTKRFSKKREPLFLRVQIKGGSLLTYPIFSDHEHAEQVGAAAVSACQAVQLSA